MRSLARIILIVATSAVRLVPARRTRAAIPPGRLAIGDSVMLGAKGELVARGFRVNATVSRQFRDAVPLVERLKAEGRLRRKVVIHLGTNGILIQAADCNRISEIAGPNRTVYPRHAQDPSVVSLRPERATCRLRRAACQHAADQLVPPQPRPSVVVRGRRLPPHAGGSGEVRGVHRFADRLIGAGWRLGRLVAVVCPSGRRDTPGKRVGGLTPSRVRIPRPPLRQRSSPYRVNERWIRMPTRS